MPNPTADYPLAIHSDVDTSGLGNTALGLTTPKHTEVEGKQEEEITAIQRKLGIGLSNAASATALQVLQKQISGETLWSSLTTSSVDESTNRRYLTDAQQIIIANFDENVEDIIGSKIIGGTNVSISYNDVTGETTISATDTGEANTASNVGSAGIGVFKQKSGVDLQFKKLFAFSNKIALVDDTANSRITIDVDQANLSLTASQISDFNTAVSSNSDVSANTAARHTHSNKALLDTYTQTEANLADAVAKKHVAATVLDTSTINFSLSGQQITGDVITQMSITSDASGLKLSGDAATPGNSKYYGTDASGTKGFFDLPATGGAVDSVNGQTGTVVLDTDDISEGANLYFTNERVDDRVAALIQDGTGISWTYNDVANTLTPAVSLASFSTTNLAEGTNLYYTAARFNTAFAAKSTTDLAEGSNLYFTNERVDDRVAALMTQGTGMTLTYDDTAGTLTVATTITQYTDEMARDAIGAALVAGAGISISVDDPGNTITITSTITQYTDEMAQDTVATMIQNGTGISWSYNDVSNTLTPTVSLSAFSTSNLSEGSNLYYTDERVDDRVAALIQNGTGISWSYNDAGGTLTPTVSLASFSTSNLSEGSNLYYTDERVDDRVASLMTAGANITLTYNDVAGTLTAAVTAAGSDSYVQYNNGGPLGGDSTFTFNDSTKALSFTTGIATQLQVSAATSSIATIFKAALTTPGDISQWQSSTGNVLALIDANGGAVFNEQGGASADVRIEGDTDANLLFTDASADSVQIGAATASDSAKLYVAGKISTSGEIEINGALNHDGSTVGFYGTTPVVQSTGWSVSNVTTDKSFDANSTSIDELADVLGTLINYLLSRGDLGA